MTAEIKVGSRLRAGTAEVIVVRFPLSPVELTCGGAPLQPLDAEIATTAEGGEEALQLGKRYVDDESGVELLCTRAGLGALACDGRALVIKGANPLPSSD